MVRADDFSDKTQYQDYVRRSGYLVMHRISDYVKPNTAATRTTTW